MQIKDILMGAQTKLPELNDLCRLVASRLPYHDITAMDMALIVMFAGHDAKFDTSKYAAEYPRLSEYVEGGGDMSKLLAKVSSVIAKGATNSEAESYAKAYVVESVRCFGPTD
ncbi:MAG: hypothetical protein MJ155_01065 [Candidatus Saccharibacteria bacterium]|nr:hypothetical protein [Candidatus Saccharibacteria bacterium]